VEAFFVGLGVEEPLISARIIADLLGKPYLLGGRGPDAYDCAGLFAEVQRRLGLPIEIPETPQRGSMQQTAMMKILAQKWHRLERPVPGCCVFFCTGAHVGTMIDQRRFLHTSELFGSAFVDSLDSPEWRNKLRLFYSQGSA
jgi:cell wall-associated NlpC family hydrolase